MDVIEIASWFFLGLMLLGGFAMVYLLWCVLVLVWYQMNSTR